MSRYIVGLTGGIGSGKSTVARLFAERGIVIVDTDAIAHRLTAIGGAGLPAIAAAFGAEVLAADGSLDRAQLRRLVFAEPARRKVLEGILHPLIRSEADRECAAASSPYVIIDVPLLVESGAYRERVQRVLVVDCSEGTQIARVQQRNGLPEAEVRAILAAQATRAARQAAADDLVDNDGDLPSLVAQVERLHADYLRRAGELPVA